MTRLQWTLNLVASAGAGLAVVASAAAWPAWVAIAGTVVGTIAAKAAASPLKETPIAADASQ